MKKPLKEKEQRNKLCIAEGILYGVLITIIVITFGGLLLNIIGVITGANPDAFDKESYNYLEYIDISYT